MTYDTFRIPDCYRELPGHALLSAVDMVLLTGLPLTTLHDHVEKGRLPQPSRRMKHALGRPHSKHHWSLADLRRWVRDHPPCAS